jgi:hypothetical protein
LVFPTIIPTPGEVLTVKPVIEENAPGDKSTSPWRIENEVPAFVMLVAANDEIFVKILES